MKGATTPKCVRANQADVEVDQSQLLRRELSAACLNPALTDK
jgi:hypothetical protein